MDLLIFAAPAGSLAHEVHELGQITDVMGHSPSVKSRQAGFVVRQSLLSLVEFLLNEDLNSVVYYYFVLVEKDAVALHAVRVFAFGVNTVYDTRDRREVRGLGAIKIYVEVVCYKLKIRVVLGHFVAFKGNPIMHPKRRFFDVG